MLTVLYPQILTFVESLSIGLWPLQLKSEPGPKLLIKATKEMLLTAKMNLGFKLYVVPIILAGKNTIGLITAFFDDEDEPLVIFTPVFQDDSSSDLLDILRLSRLDIHFFDEHSREFLGYTSEVNHPPEAHQRLENSLCPFDLELAASAHTQMKTWFGLRSSQDDLSAISISLKESHFGEDMVIIDAREDSHPYPGSPAFSFSQLERKEPGSFQELDIARSLGRIFAANEIVMNPLHVSDDNELSDIMLVTDSEIVILQAKDSPNTEKILRNSLARKKLTAQKNLFKALDQVRGALRYIMSMTPLRVKVGSEIVEIKIGSRKIRALIIVKELFEDQYAVYSPPLIEFSRESGIPCIALDYGELLAYTELSSKEKFFQAFDLVHFHGRDTGQFPRLRIWKNDEL